LTGIPEISTDFLKKINRKTLSKRFKNFLLLTTAVFIAVLFCSGEYGLAKIYRLHNKIDAAEKEIDHLKAQAVDYQWEINKLKSDSQYIKLYASEIYGYAKENQTIIQFLPSPDDTLK